MVRKFKNSTLTRIGFKPDKVRNCKNFTDQAQCKLEPFGKCKCRLER